MILTLLATDPPVDRVYLQPLSTRQYAAIKRLTGKSNRGAYALYRWSPLDTDHHIKADGLIFVIQRKKPLPVNSLFRTQNLFIAIRRISFEPNRGYFGRLYIRDVL